MRTALLLLPAIIITSCNLHSRRPANTEAEAQTHHAPITETSIDLTVITIPTTDKRQEDSLNKGFSYPATVNVSNADTLCDQIAAYGGAYEVWLAPKGWTGEAEVGIDGFVKVKLHPLTDSSGRGPHFQYIEIPSCQECIARAAAPWFPAAMKWFGKNFGHGTASPAPLPQGIRINSVSPSLIIYTLPAKNGLMEQGVVYFVAPAAGDPYFASAAFVLPEAQQKLADLMINYYVLSRRLN